MQAGPGRGGAEGIGGTASGPASGEDSPRRRPYAISFTLAASVICLLDLWSKHYWFERYPPRAGPPEIHALVGDLLAVMSVLNTGIPWGLLGGNTGVLAVVSAVAALLILLLFYRWTRSDDPLWAFGLAAILGGALGNLYDRAFIGAVRDWILFVPRLPVVGQWPVFNLADAFIVIGAGLVFLSTCRSPAPEPGSPAE